MVKGSVQTRTEWALETYQLILRLPWYLKCMKDLSYGNVIAEMPKFFRRNSQTHDRSAAQASRNIFSSIRFLPTLHAFIMAFMAT
jgi:hypothetical protein